MRHPEATSNAPKSSRSHGTKSAGKASVALLALGTPLLAAAPAAAGSGGADGHPGVPSSAAAPADVPASIAAGDSGQAPVETSATTDVSANAPSHNNASQGGPTPNASEPGASQGGPTPNAPGASQDGPTPSAPGPGAAAGGHANHRAAAPAGFDAGGDAATPGAGGHTDEGAPSHSRVESSAQPRGDAQTRLRNVGSVPRRHGEGEASGHSGAHGDIGLTDVRLSPRHDDEAAGRVSALVKASPGLEAALRAEARAAARDEVSARFPKREAGGPDLEGFVGSGSHVEGERPVEQHRPGDSPGIWIRRARLHGQRAAREAERQGARSDTAASGPDDRGADTLPERTRATGAGAVPHAPGRAEETNTQLVAGSAIPPLEAPVAGPTTNALPDSGLDAGFGGIVPGPRPGTGPAAAVTTPLPASAVGDRREAGAMARPAQLPFTGAELPWVFTAGVGLLAAGALLRRRTNRALR
jgi:hypothetical protein